MDEPKNQPTGEPENQGETAPFVLGGDDPFVIPESSDPQSIGRYRVIRTIGKGGFAAREVRVAPLGHESELYFGGG